MFLCGDDVMQDYRTLTMAAGIVIHFFLLFVMLISLTNSLL